MFKIRKKIIAYILLLAVMAAAPVAALKFTEKSSTSESRSTKDTAKTLSDENKILIGLTAAVCKEDFCDEAIKAAAILIKNNYTVSPEKYDLSDENIFLAENKIESSQKEYYKKVKQAVVSISDLNFFIAADNEHIYIPYSDISRGYTEKSDKSDYFIPVASPWDCFSENYNKSAECVGVSINGLNYLCSNSQSAEQALKWYLPKLNFSQK